MIKHCDGRTEVLLQGEYLEGVRTWHIVLHEDGVALCPYKEKVDFESIEELDPLWEREFVFPVMGNIYNTVDIMPVEYLVTGESLKISYATSNNLRDIVVEINFITGRIKHLIGRA